MHADGTKTALAYSVSAGLSFRGPFADREKDTFGIAATRAHADPQGKAQLSSDAGMPLTSTGGTVVDVTYKAQVVPGVVLQPLIRRIFNPGQPWPLPAEFHRRRRSFATRVLTIDV